MCSLGHFQGFPVIFWHLTGSSQLYLTFHIPTRDMSLSNTSGSGIFLNLFVYEVFIVSGQEETKTIYYYNIYMYIYIYIHTHTHIYIYIYFFYLKNDLFQGFALRKACFFSVLRVLSSFSKFGFSGFSGSGIHPVYVWG